MLGYSSLPNNCYFRSISIKLGSLNRKFFLNIKNGLNLENPITNKSVDPYVQTEIIFIFTAHLIQGAKLGAYTITNESEDPYSPFFFGDTLYINIFFSGANLEKK